MSVDRDIIWVGSPNFGYGRGVRGQNHAKALVWHITGSSPNVPPLPPLSGLDGWFQNPAAGSTQLGIQDKAIHQYVRLQDAAWGNGLMRGPDLSNDIIKRWWDLGINPNVETWSVEVVSQAGPNNVQVGEHRVNQDTWDSMVWLGAHLAQTTPELDEFVVFQWQGHYMIDSLSRARDPITIYRPDDVRQDVVKVLAEGRPPELGQGGNDMLWVVQVPRDHRTFLVDGFQKRHMKDAGERDYWLVMTGLHKPVEITRQRLDRLDGEYPA